MYIPGHRAQNNFHAIIHLRTCAASGGNKGLAHINSAGVVAAAIQGQDDILGNDCRYEPQATLPCYNVMQHYFPPLRCPSSQVFSITTHWSPCRRCQN